MSKRKNNTNRDVHNFLHRFMAYVTLCEVKKREEEKRKALHLLLKQRWGGGNRKINLNFF